MSTVEPVSAGQATDGDGPAPGVHGGVRRHRALRTEMHPVAAARGGGSRVRRATFVAAEGLTAFAAAAVSVQLSRSIVVDPLDRIGQVSGVAGLDLRFLVLGLTLVGLAVVAVNRGPIVWDLVSRVVCAAVAGLATGLVAGGVLLALRGTDWPLFADRGDSGQLLEWADDLLAGVALPADYPSAVIYLIAGLADLTGSTPEALRLVQVVATAAFGPVAYLAWRLVVPPVWALVVTVVAALPLLEPYKPYTTVVLVVLVPLLIAFLTRLGRADAASWPRVVGTGLVVGGSLAALFHVYSGWFVWSAPGAVAVALWVIPWRTAPVRGLLMLTTAVGTFAALAWTHLLGLLRAAVTVQDDYFYFDTFVDPAYIAMWRNDLPGDVGPWPPPGELGGVGVFTVLLAVGLGVAVALGRRRLPVVTLCALLAGSWVLRLWFASTMFETQSVQLYPRTSAEILYCLLLLSIIAVRLAWERTAQVAWAPTPRTATIGALAACLLLAMSIGSSVADRYMPRDDGSVGLLAYVAQMVRQPDGRCPDYSSPDRCAASTEELLGPDR